MSNTLKKTDFNLEPLAMAILSVHEQLLQRATKAVNIGVTLRNWIIGGILFEYEQHGTERAVYGDELLEKLSHRLASAGVSGVSVRSLRLYRKFYLVYPQIRQSLTAESQVLLEALPIWQSLIAKSKKVRDSQVATQGKVLLENLSFTHMSEILQLPDPTQRAFYEMECIRGAWSVRELKRQIASLYYQRSGLSKNKKKLSELTQAKAEKFNPAQVIRDPYIFEFLGLKAQEVMGESQLEDALLDKLQEFILELGHGFCFEARQKRIVIGGEKFFVDLVFYHRVLKCHVLVELKTKAFNHENLGQLNAYVGYYKKHQMTAGDNPPVGILLCTKKNHPLVEFALGGMSNKLFVSRYAVAMPKKEEMERFILEMGRGGRDE